MRSRWCRLHHDWAKQILLSSQYCQRPCIICLQQLLEKVQETWWYLLLQCSCNRHRLRSKYTSNLDSESLNHSKLLILHHSLNAILQVTIPVILSQQPSMKEMLHVFLWRAKLPSMLAFSSCCYLEFWKHGCLQKAIADMLLHTPDVSVLSCEF